jgi:hypothetical protein
MDLVHQLLPLVNSDNVSDFDFFFDKAWAKEIREGMSLWLLQRIFSHSFEHGDLQVNSPGQLISWGAASAVHQ